MRLGYRILEETSQEGSAGSTKTVTAVDLYLLKENEIFAP